MASNYYSIFKRQYPITQQYGNRNPGIEVFNRSGVNTGTDIGVGDGTEAALPGDANTNWDVVEAYGGARGRGYIGNSANKGYGNSVVVVNPQTGEKLRYSHLLKTAVQPGSRLKAGTIVGLTGATGNVTGSHLDLEYYDSSGRVKNVANSNYGQMLFGGMSPTGFAQQQVNAMQQAIGGSQFGQAISKARNFSVGDATNIAKKMFGNSVKAISTDPSKFSGGGKIVKIRL